MQIYSFRAECQHDFDELLKVLHERKITVSVTRVEPNLIRMNDNPRFDTGEVLVELGCSLPLEPLREVVRAISDSHVLLQTLRPIRFAQNGFERDYSILDAHAERELRRAQAIAEGKKGREYWETKLGTKCEQELPTLLGLAYTPALKQLIIDTLLGDRLCRISHEAAKDILREALIPEPIITQLFRWEVEVYLAYNNECLVEEADPTQVQRLMSQGQFRIHMRKELGAILDKELTPMVGVLRAPVLRDRIISTFIGYHLKELSQEQVLLDLSDLGLTEEVIGKLLYWDSDVYNLYKPEPQA